MKINKVKEILYILLITGFSSLFITRPEIQPAEQMDVQVAYGTDFEKVTEDVYEYVITRCSYVFEEENKRSSKVIVSKGQSFAIARESRMQLADKAGIAGLEKVYIFSEAYARYGLRQSVDIIFKNPLVNDTAIFVISKNKSSDIMKYEPPIYATSADFIEMLIKSQRDLNFLPDEYDAMNIYVRLDSEGRNFLVPYIELNEEGIVLTGQAVFKEDKMVAKVDMKDSKTINMLKYSNVKGMFTIQKSAKEYIDFSANVKRKVKCLKKEDKYNFIIDLKLQGEIISNTFEEKLSLNTNNIKDFENAMAEQVKQQCNDFIGKMKNELKVDCLELGRVAAAKYGRRKGNDWNEIISNSTIEVNVKVKVDSHGRGDF